MKIEDIFTTLLLTMAWVGFLLLALPAKAENQQWQNQIENNPLMDNLRANQLMQIEQQKLQIMQEQLETMQDQALKQDLQLMIEKSNSRLYE